MKTKDILKKTSLNFLMAFIFFNSVSTLLAQTKNTHLKDFKISIEKTHNGLKMKCVKGCAWIDLTFDINDYIPQAIDDHGMINLKEVQQNQTGKNSHFLFTIMKTKNEIKLKGLKGTAWTELTFSLNQNQKQAINQYGLTNLK